MLIRGNAHWLESGRGGRGVPAETIELSYHGGLADEAKMHFYEYSRASYGFARLLITAEHFRRSGRVAQKIGRKNYVDLIVGLPSKGSFVTQVLVPMAAGTMPELAGVPIRAMLAYIFQLLTPRSEETDETVVELAKIRLQEEQTASSQSSDVHTLIKIIETQTATTREALRLVRYALRSTNPAVRRLHDDPEQFREMEKELKAQLEQERTVKDVEQLLGVLDPRSVARLSSRVRPMFGEMALPMRWKDIREFTIGAANENRPLAYFNAARVAALESKSVEEEPVTIECRVHGYDRDAGVGRVSSPELPRRLKFIVPPERRNYLHPKILEAMDDRVDTVLLEVLRVVDRSKMPTSLILLDVRLNTATRDSIK